MCARVYVSVVNCYRDDDDEVINSESIKKNRVFGGANRSIKIV